MRLTSLKSRSRSNRYSISCAISHITHQQVCRKPNKQASNQRGEEACGSVSLSLFGHSTWRDQPGQLHDMLRMQLASSGC